MVCEYICFILDRELRGLKYLSGSQSFPSYYVATRLNYSSDTTRDVEAEAEAVEAVLFLWKRKRENSTASAST